MFAVGFCLYNSLVLIALFLQTLMGYVDLVAKVTPSIGQ
jgi:hypothetical protein